MEVISGFLAHIFEPEFLTQHSRYLLLIILVFSFLEVVIPPIPGDTLLIMGSSAAVIAGIHPFFVILIAFIGTFSASLLLYQLGLKLEHKVLESPQFKWILDTKTFLKIQTWFSRFGFGTILLSRFLPVARSGIILAAGIVNYKRKQTLIALTLSVFLSTTIIVYCGRFIGKRWEDISQLISPWKQSIYWGLLIVGIGMVVVIVFKNYFRNYDKK